MLLGFAILFPLLLGTDPPEASPDGNAVDITAAPTIPNMGQNEGPTEPTESATQPTTTTSPPATPETVYLTVTAEIEKCLRVDTHIVCSYRDGRTIALDATQSAGIDLTSALVGVGAMVSASGALLSGLAAWQGHRLRARSQHLPARGSKPRRRRRAKNR